MFGLIDITLVKELFEWDIHDTPRHLASSSLKSTRDNISQHTSWEWWMGVRPFYSTGQKIWDLWQIMKASIGEFAYNCLLESFPIMLQLETQLILVIILK
jgi:hypothetical protein